MASNISETPTYEANVVGPDAGDAVTAAAIRTGLQDLANRTAFMKAFLDSGAVGWTATADVGTEQVVTVELLHIIRGVANSTNQIIALATSPTPRSGALAFFRWVGASRSYTIRNGSGGSSLVAGILSELTVFGFDGTNWVLLAEFADVTP